MDARITKQRLSNMLSYDWLKILAAIAAAALALALFFTMIATRATDGQTYMVYAYNGLSTGRDYAKFGDTIAKNGTFSYDILNTGTEVFSDGGIYGGAVFTARRSAGEGRVMFVSDYKTTDKDGNPTSSRLDDVAAMGLVDGGTQYEKMGMFLNPEDFLNDCKAYLEAFFGAGLTREEPDEAKTREAFLARNGKDKRFRKAKQKEAGVKLERERLIKLKADYLTVSEKIEDGKLPYAEYKTTVLIGEETTKENVYKIGFRMENLTNLRNLFFYEDEVGGEKVKSSEKIVLTLFDNGDREGDLRYETVNFIAYLLKAYGNTAQE